MNYYQHRFETVHEYLHHRSPYLLVEEIHSITERQIITSKRVSANEPWIKGHFPGAPIFPGAMMQELVTQSAGILMLQTTIPSWSLTGRVYWNMR